MLWRPNYTSWPRSAFIYIKRSEPHYYFLRYLLTYFCLLFSSSFCSLFVFNYVLLFKSFSFSFLFSFPSFLYFKFSFSFSIYSANFLLNLDFSTFFLIFSLPFLLINFLFSSFPYYCLLGFFLLFGLYKLPCLLFLRLKLCL